MQDIANTEILVAKNSNNLKVLAEISKVKITILVSLTTALGYILAAKSISISLLFSVLGIFLLACSASALNQYQESELDKLMMRTKNRPIPSSRVSANFVFNVAITFLFAGTAILYFFTNINTLIIGLFTLLWYNGVYTPLKRKSALAIFPGSLVGALPPIAGWTAAGGSLSDFNIYLIAFYFFIWQIPHFWLLLLLHGKDYHSAGFPVLNNIFPDSVLKKFTFVWILITVLVTIAIAFSKILNYQASILIVILASFFLLYNSR